MENNNPWFRVWPARCAPKVRLVCFPHAGAGASMCAGWTEHLPNGVELVAIELPGRESRLRETPLIDVRAMKTALTEHLPQLIGLPTALFGYSFGGIIAFEVARQATILGIPICHLFVGVIHAPHVVGRMDVITDIPDDAFLQAVQEKYGGIPRQITDQPELLALILPALRADIQCMEGYVYETGKRLNCPITALSGSDDAVTSMAAVAAWSEHTLAGFRHRVFPGGHFFIREHFPQVMKIVGEKLGECADDIDAASPQRTAT